MDTALAAGASVGLVAGTCSIPEEQILTAALFALGEERSNRLHTFTCSLTRPEEQDAAQQDNFAGLSMEQSMAAARARVRCASRCLAGPCKHSCAAAILTSALHSCRVSIIKQSLGLA